MALIILAAALGLGALWASSLDEEERKDLEESKADLLHDLRKPPTG